MKNLIFSFITLLIFLRTTTHAQEKPDAVLDTEGNPLLRGESYYVVWMDTIPGQLISGIVPHVVSNLTCTYGVSLALYILGIPVAFSIDNNPPKVGGAIHELTDLNISFSIPTGCAQSNLWKRGDYDNATEQYFVEIGGVEPRGKPVIGTIGDAFQIRKVADDYYKFVFCPRTCAGSCQRKCYDVGNYFVDGVSRLAVSGEIPFYVRFVKSRLAKY